MSIDTALWSTLGQFALQTIASAAVAAFLAKTLLEISLGRLERREQLEQDRLLEQVRSELRRSVDERLAEIASELDVTRTKLLGAHALRIDLYTNATEPFLSFVTDIESGTIDSQRLIEFNRQRLRTHARLALFAPQPVVDAYNEVVDYLFDVLDGKKAYSWTQLRAYAFVYFNTARADIGLGDGQIAYRGNR